jgi:hypothetical protein
MEFKMALQQDTLGKTLPLSWVEEAKLVAANKVANDNFGYSVAVSADGSTLVVGSYLADRSNVSDCGSIYVYTKVEGVWEQQAELQANDKTAVDYFGWSVAVSATGNTVVVGSRLADNGGVINSGAAYVFSRTDTSWAQHSKLTAANKATGDLFGWSVAISGDASTIVIGSTYADPNAVSDSGAAYVFAMTDGLYVEEARLTASDKAAGDQFGTSVAVSSLGNTIIVGSRYADVSTVSNSGAAYVFNRSGGVWTQQAKLSPEDRVANDNFGISVSISGDGDRVVVGSHQTDVSSLANVGSLYVFVRVDNTWNQQAKLTAFDQAAGDNLGWSVAMSSDGNTIVSGAYYNDPTSVINAGATYAFTYVNEIWNEQSKLVASDKVISDYFGWSVAVSGDGTTVVSASRLADLLGTANAGAVYVYQA